MKTYISKLFRLAALGAAGLAFIQSLTAANLINGGFDTVTGTNANYWSGGASPAGALPGTLRGGNQGGFGWTTGYFGGSYPTNNTFATTVNGPVRQDLSGAGNTFVAGATYSLSMEIFGSSTYMTNKAVLWSLGLTADGVGVAIDHWFSDEFSGSTVAAAAGGTIPNDHIVTVASGSTGLRTVTLTYTATAADAGKVIGVRLGGDTQSRYTLAAGAPTADDYFGMMDSVTLVSGSAEIKTFTSDSPVIDAAGFYLSWHVDNPDKITTLTLDSGSGPINVLPDTDLGSGDGFRLVTPSTTTTYTLNLNGSQSSQVTVQAGKAVSLTTSARVAIAPAHQVTLSWSALPIGAAAVSLSDGTSTIDVTADTDPETGLGSKLVTVPNPSTTYTLSVNGSPLVAKVRVLRETSNTAAFSVSSASVENGQQITVTWSGAAGGNTDWVGIYQVGETPGGTNEYSDAWNYLNGTRTAGPGPTAGSMTFTMPVGNYYAVLLLADGYEVAQGPLVFSVVQPPAAEEVIKVTSITKAANAVTLVWESKAGFEYDIYASDSLEGDPQVDWDEVSLALPSDGDETTDFTETFGSGAPTHRFYRIYEFESTP